MNILTIEKLSKSYGMKVLFEEASLTINDDDKMGLIGVNGTGKSTLLKIISQIENPDSGSIYYMKGVRIEYLNQNQQFDLDATILEQIFKGSSDEVRTIRLYEETLEAIEEDLNNEVLQNKLMDLSAKMKDLDLWDYESQVKTILTKLGIHHFNKKVGELSGGQKKRIALATALITPCDLLILDEPTNHMDNSTIDWLESFLSQRKGALLMVTHDRYFLDRVVNKTIELDKGTLFTYSGNYTQFIEKKLERQELEHSIERKRENLYRRELAWIRRGARGRSTKQKARIERFEDVRDAKANLEIDEIEISVGSTRLGSKIVEINNVSKSFGSLNVVKDYSYILLRDDRIGIIGDNGTGKSTLLNLIVGKLEPDTGFVDIGKTVKIGYFSQESEDMDEELKAIDYIKETAEFVTTADGTKISASKLMETFLFESDMQYTQIARLSGGERRRLYLLKILIGEPNILILDEPTNDLDIDTLKVLENYIDYFSGAVVAVSHDRYFLDRIAHRIFVFEGEGKIGEYMGNYSDYMESHKSKITGKALPASVVSEQQEVVKEKQGKVKTTNEYPKLTFKENEEFKIINSEIDKLEARLSEIEKAMNECGSDYTLLQELQEENELVEMDLLEKLERQEYLSQKDELNKG